jgi:hypothetical protein
LERRGEFSLSFLKEGGRKKFPLTKKEEVKG